MSPEWKLFFDLLDNGWPGELTPGQADAYEATLGTPDARVLAALNRLLHAGARFRPSPAEILGEARNDPSIPTFDEMLRLVFGKDGILAARPPLRGSPADVIAAWEAGEEWDTADVNGGAWLGHTRAEATDAVQLERAAESHPLIASFVQRLTLQRLRGYNVAPEQGEDGKRIDTWDLRDLRIAWGHHCEAVTGREVAALAAGTGRRGLAQLDPLAVLGVGDEAVQIGAGESTS
jgi:hypothetical protein